MHNGYHGGNGWIYNCKNQIWQASKHEIRGAIEIMKRYVRSL